MEPMGFVFDETKSYGYKITVITSHLGKPSILKPLKSLAVNAKLYF